MTLGKKTERSPVRLLMFIILLFLSTQGLATATLTAPEEAAWTYPVPVSVLEDPTDVLRLINRENQLDRAYPDQSIDLYKLVPVTAPTTKRGFLLRSVSNDAISEMLAGRKGGRDQALCGIRLP